MSDTKFNLLLITGLAFLTAAVFGLTYLLSSAACHRIGIQTEHAVDYYFLGGCFIELEDGRSVPIDENSIGLFLED